jgi:hypothetical protein
LNVDMLCVGSVWLTGDWMGIVEWEFAVNEEVVLALLMK